MRSLAALGSKNLRIKIGILSDSFSHTVSLPSGDMVAVIKKGYSGLSDWEVQPFSNSGKRIQGAIITFCFSFAIFCFPIRENNRNTFERNEFKYFITDV